MRKEATDWFAVIDCYLFIILAEQIMTADHNSCKFDMQERIHVRMLKEATDCFAISIVIILEKLIDTCTKL